MKQTIITSLITAIISFNAFAGENRSFDQYSREAINAANKILIDFGKCSDVNDCTKKQYVFFNPISQGIELHFYGVTEEVLVQKIFGMLAQQYYSLPEGSSLHARFISSTKESDLKRSFFESTPVFAEIHMQDRQKPNNSLQPTANASAE
ncbi:hypothetical protein Q7A_03365 [Methylophaga nitratireducenticrescens]|uniref:hypothetical protein n=1 Tax=Methylophaga nitratireducenticrescens TaxID=754476 RepID=UPI00059CFBAC|nr:hypothetical protein [Methylophaga nitratireducenticrescens]ASF49085.1 hypothetical protein Q7A_03365 [Methylophaga nitratireducenticrescens]